MSVTLNLDKKVINLIIYAGWTCLLLSSTCFYISTRSIGIDEPGSELTYALWLIVARLFGIGAFIVAGFSIFNQRWTHGTLLFIGSVALPFLSLFIHGSI
jgi:hypothetical protein